MTALKYFESTIRSKELLKEALAFINAHGLTANPVNYTVCYEYFRGDHLLLKQKFDQALAEKTVLTDQLVSQWFQDYLTDNEQNQLKQSQADLVSIISKLSESTLQAENNVIQFDKALKIGEKELGETRNNASLDSIVGYLLENTQVMQASIELMKQQIQESKQEIQSLQERLERATEEALSDPLTGLTNRKGLTRSIEEAIAAAEESKSYPCLLVVDIDHFKSVNDNFGHLLGDKVIKAVADTLRNQIKGKDTAARYGGEEFCVLLPETELQDSIKVAENIRRAVERTRIKRTSDNQEICRVTVSIGTARYKPLESVNALFERADSALYKSKNKGRNQVTCAAE